MNKIRNNKIRAKRTGRIPRGAGQDARGGRRGEMKTFPFPVLVAKLMLKPYADATA